MRAAIVVAAALLLSGCWPGSDGWECSSDGDCSGGRTCRSVREGENGSFLHVCLAADRDSYTGTKGTWPLFLVGCFAAIGIPLAFVWRLATSGARRRQREMDEIAFAPEPPGAGPRCPDPACAGVAPRWKDLSFMYACPRCGREFPPS